MDLPATPGVYAIRNRDTRKVYVGSALRLSKRWTQHRTDLQRGVHFNLHLQAAWNRDGAAAFDFIVLERCPAAYTLAAEQTHIDNLCASDRRCGYNSRPRAESNLGRKATPEQIEANRQARLGTKHRPESIELIRAAQKSRVYPPEFGAAVSAGKLGGTRPDWASKSHSEKTRRYTDAQVAEFHRLRGDKNTYRQIAEIMGCSIETAHSILNGNRRYTKG